MKKPFYKRWWFIAIVVIFALGVIGSAFGGGEETETADSNDNETIETSAPTKESAEEPTKTPETDVEEEPKVEEESVPREYKSALKKAETYAKTMHMSKAGIYDQLVSEYGEGFPPEAAQYAIDNIEWDWKENALKKAKTYAEMMSMSDTAIYEQLVSEYGEKFTPEEAQYAIDNLE